MSTPRFLCDVMLKGLGRWLRAAGYDTLIAADRSSDAALLRQAAADHRCLLTCDRQLGDGKPLGSLVILLASADPDDAASELRQRLALDWLHAPFTRCLVDNQELLPASPADRASLPEPAATGIGPFRRCPACHRRYWPGSHVRRMRSRLERWQAGA